MVTYLRRNWRAWAALAAVWLLAACAPPAQTVHAPPTQTVTAPPAQTVTAPAAPQTPSLTAAGAAQIQVVEFYSPL